MGSIKAVLNLIPVYIPFTKDIMLYFWRGLAMQPRKELYHCKSIYLLLSFFFIIITSKVKSFYIDSILITMIKHCAVLTKTWKEWAKHRTKPHRCVTHFFTKYILRVQEAKQTTDTLVVLWHSPCRFQHPLKLPNTVMDVYHVQLKNHPSRAL